MLLPLLISTMLGQSPALPPDTSLLQYPKSGSGMLLSAAVSQVDQENFRTGLGPVVGWYYFRNINPRLRFQIEFQGKLITGYKIASQFEDYTVNPKGSSVSTAEFDLRSLVFFEMPLLLSIRPNATSKHAFFAGLRPGINLITGRQEGGSGMHVTNGAFPTDFSGLSMRDAVSPVDLGVCAGWNFAFSQRLSLDIRYTQGLVDLTADNFFKEQSNTLNSDLQLGLRVNF